MKKCKDCQKEIDKLMIACEYCGKLQEHEEKLQENQEDSPTDKVQE